MKTVLQALVSLALVFVAWYANAQTSNNGSLSQFGSISSSPTGADVYIDGVRQGATTPVENLSLIVGDHQVKITMPLYHDFSTTLTVSKEEQFTPTYTLTPNFGSVTITSTPAGSTIWINGEQQGTDRWSGRLDTGSHTISIRRNQYYTQNQRFDMEVDTDQTLTFELQPITGTIAVVTDPTEAQVAVDSVSRGNSPLYIRNLQIGTHEVTITKAGYAPITETIRVAENQTHEVNATLVRQRTIHLTSTPTGANVYLDYSYQGITPLDIAVAYDGQSHTLALQTEDCYTTNTQTINATSIPSSLTVAMRVTTINGSEMITVRGGTFTMGSNRGASDEQPTHPVTVSNFCISKYEITNAQYAAYMNAIGASRRGSVEGKEYLNMSRSSCQISYSGGRFVAQSGKGNHPVVMVTWHGANAYCQYYGGCLPTEAEWEFAARGGNSSSGYTYSGSNTLDSVAWYEDNSGNPNNDMYKGKGIYPVGTKRANELGIHDMSGNVWEWCSDRYSSATDSQCPESGSDRMYRGGSWGDSATDCRVANRGSGTPDLCVSSIGFRLAVSL